MSDRLQSPSNEASRLRALSLGLGLGLGLVLSLGALWTAPVVAQHAHGHGQHGQSQPAAQAPHGQHGQHGAVSTAVSAVAEEGYAQAEVRRVDAEAGRVTLRHGEIVSMDMPPMTMVFHATDKAMLQGIQAGDQVQFKARKDNGRYVLTEIKRAP